MINNDKYVISFMSYLQMSMISRDSDLQYVIILTNDSFS